MSGISKYIGVGLTGAVSVAVIDSVVLLNAKVSMYRYGRMAARLTIAGAVAGVAYWLDAPDWVTGGIIAGSVLITAFDLVIAVVPRRRLEPPASDAASLGDPWAPSPPYTLSLNRR